MSDFNIAHGCFLLACFILWVKIIHLGIRNRKAMTYLLVFLGCGAIGILALAAVQYVEQKREEKMKKEDAQSQASPLEIIFDPKDPKLDLWIHNEHKGQKVDHHLFRVRIHNRSDRTIEGIQVKLDHTEPDVSKFQDLLLQQTGDNPTTFDDYPKWDKYQKEFTLTPKNSQLIDVIYTDSRKTEVSFIQHIVGSVSRDLPVGYYKLFITVSAKGVIPITRVFETVYDPRTQKLAFWPQQDKIADGQPDATKSDAEAIINAERANLLFERITVHGIRELIKAQKPEGVLEITYRMRNHGKTLGWTTNITFQALVSKEFDLPIPPVFDNPTTTKERYAVLPNAPFDTFDKFQIQNFKITLDQAKDILASRQYLFVYGFVEFDDQFERSHHNGFAYCYRFNYYRDKSGDEADFREPVGGPVYWVSK